MFECSEGTGAAEAQAATACHDAHSAVPAARHTGTFMLNANAQRPMAVSWAAYSARLGRQQLGLAAVALALVFFLLGFSAGRSNFAPHLNSLLRARNAAGPPPPRPLLNDLSLQPSAGAAALPFSCTKHPERRAARLLPDQLGQWREYAVARRCSLEDGDYEQIFQQLEPWRTAGGIAEAAVEAAHARLDSTTLFEVRGGRLANASSWGENRQSVEYWRSVLAELAPLLPDVKLLFSSYDKPRSWVAPLPPAAEAALRSGALGEREAWLRHGCDGAGAGFAALRSRHAAFARTGVRVVRGLLPVFSGATIPGCYGDLLVPRLWGSTPAELDEPPKHSGCPMANQSWHSKKDVAFWRGSSTGSWIDGSIPAQLWTSWHRQRLVALSQRHPAHLDAAFTALVGYLVVVDGNSIANRLAASLCSGSVVLLSQLFCEWFAYRLEPGRHFVPVKLDYSDLVSQVDALRADPQRAQRIVAAATDVVNTRLREEDARCYMLRLLLEYAALYRPRRQGQQAAQQPQQQQGAGNSAGQAGG
ncbi:hypothetical protein ABPG75_005518 [Micractinium tetrahymenae]